MAAKRRNADAAARAEAKAVVERWNEQLAAGRDMLFFPTRRPLNGTWLMGAQPRSTGFITVQDDEPICRSALPRFGRTVRESGTWTRMLDPHAGIKAARGGARAQVNEDGAFCCWCGLPATSLLRRWLGSLLACF